MNPTVGIIFDDCLTDSLDQTFANIAVSWLFVLDQQLVQSVDDIPECVLHRQAPDAVRKENRITRKNDSPTFLRAQVIADEAEADFEAFEGVAGAIVLFDDEPLAAGMFCLA